MIVAAVGLFGAVAAVMVAKYGWRDAYKVGGGLGIILLLLRIGTFESGMFKNIEQAHVSKGNFFMLLNNWQRFKKYLCCILIGVPLWYVVGVLITLSPEFGKALNAKDTLNAGDGILSAYIGIAVGGIIAGLLSQVTRSRKLVMFIFLILSAISVIVYLKSTGLTSRYFVLLCFFMGCGVGHWTIFITIAAEQFGTNIRATVATTVPNFVRGSLIPVNIVFVAFKDHYGMITSGYIVMGILTVIALSSLTQLKETFGKDLNYLEIS